MSTMIELSTSLARIIKYPSGIIAPGRTLQRGNPALVLTLAPHWLTFEADPQKVIQPRYGSPVGGVFDFRSLPKPFVSFSAIT